MNEKELINAVAEKVDITKTLSEKVIKTAIATIEEEVAKGDVVKIPGFGKFEVRKFKAKKGTNPKTGEPIKIPARLFPKFKAGKNFIELVESKKKGKKRGKK